MKRSRVGAGVLVGFFVFSGPAFCADLTHYSVSSEAIQIHVPYVGDGGVKNGCGLAALAMAANYWGQDLTVGELRKEVSRPKTPISSLELIRLAGRHDLWAYPYRGSIPDIKTKLQAGVPLITLLNFGLGPLSITHYGVITGFNPNKKVICFHTTWKKDSFLSVSVFDFFWSRTEYTCLLVIPPEKINFSLTSKEYNSLGLFYLGKDKPAKAAECFLNALKLEDYFLYRFNLAVCREKEGRKEEAKELYREVAVKNDFGPAYNNLAEIILEEDTWEAENLTRKAISSDPSRQAYYLDTLGRALILQGKVDEGREALRKALQEAWNNFPELVPLIEEHLNSE